MKEFKKTKKNFAKDEYDLSIAEVQIVANGYLNKGIIKNEGTTKITKNRK